MRAASGREPAQMGGAMGTGTGRRWAAEPGSSVLLDHPKLGWGAMAKPSSRLWLMASGPAHCCPGALLPHLVIRLAPSGTGWGPAR